MERCWTQRFSRCNLIDEDGLSFYRMDFITPEQLAENNTHSAGVFYAYLNAGSLLEMNLTLKPSPDELCFRLLLKRSQVCQSADEALALNALI
jgi:hypothetical protein